MSEQKPIPSGIKGLCDGKSDILKCTQHNIIPSMTFRSDPYENTAAERLNGILKYEFDLKDHFTNFSIAQQEVQKAIKLFNSYRLHWSLGLKTPDFIYDNPEFSKPVLVY